MKPRKGSGSFNSEDGSKSPYHIDIDSDAEDENDENEIVDLRRQILSRNGFEFVRELRSGVSGDVLLLKFNGDDPEMLRLMKEDGIVLAKIQVNIDDLANDDSADAEKKQEKTLKKHAEKSFLNEWNNIHTSLAANIPDDEELLRPETYAIEIEGLKVILNECIYSNESRTEAKDLEKHVREIGNTHGLFFKFHPDQRLIDADVKATTLGFNKIFADMVAAQRQLHRAGLLHLDSLPRNFVVTDTGGVKIIDFGASLRMDAHGKAINDPRFSVNPLTAYNRDAIRKSRKNNTDAAFCKSIHTDLFSIKIAIMETLGYYMGLNTSNIDKALHYPGLPSADREGLLAVDDATRLQNSLHNLTELARSLASKNDQRGEIVLEIINQYSKYLTSVPAARKVEQVVQQDYAAFQQCQPTVNNMAGLMKHLNVTPDAALKQHENAAAQEKAESSSEEQLGAAVQPASTPEISDEEKRTEAERNQFKG